MNDNTGRSLKLLLVLLTLGVWGVVLRPFVSHEPAQAQGQGTPQVGRYALVSGDGAVIVLDTATGTYKRTDQVHTYTSTWDKNYLNGTVVPPEDKK